MEHIAAIRNSNLRCEGVNYFLADGEAAMQEVAHTHLHVFPRFEGDGFGLVFSDEYETLPTRTELNKIGEMIRSRL
jgi:histidine triad (HIT) family protein